MENPGILERLLETGEIKMGGEGSTLNFPSARMPWPFTHEKSRDRPPAHYFRDGYLPTFGTLSHHQGCLGIRHETALPSPPPTPTPHATSPDRTAELEEAIRSAGALETLLPPGSDLWLRTMFDEDGGLHWWAVRNTPVGLRILARGESRPGAEQELKSASWWFDLAIEQIWAGYEARPLAGTQDDLLAVEQFAAYLRKPALAAALREAARREPFERAFQGVAKAGHTRLAAVWSEILDLMSKRTPEATELRVLADCWDAVLGRAAEPWPALPDPTEPEALSRLTVREHRRRSELEEASRKHLDVLRLHLDLTPLWQTAPDPAAWADVDVLIQPQGPLWGFPMAWLDFGGEPLFSRVASTGSVVSLTLRDIARRDTPKAAEAPRQLLAAHWLDAASWERGMSGPVYLHASLEKLARRAGWSLVGLADDPEASAGLLRAALGAYPARVVVINAHGDENKAAVHLAGGKWDGGGADLSGVDLVFLVACGVGRLRQDGRHDVEGLFAELAAHHGRCAITARCPIADREAAAFAAEVVKCYLDEAADHSVPLPPFTRARALNRARRRLLAKDSPVPITTHLAAAFDIYNLG